MNAMLTKDVVRETLDRLKATGSAFFSVYGSRVNVTSLGDDDKVHLSTELYHGSGFIPFSVRSCIHQAPPMPLLTIPTYVSLLEDESRIDLNYLGKIKYGDVEGFKKVLEQFCWAAEEWRIHIDDHDQRDLLHVRAR